MLTLANLNIVNSKWVFKSKRDAASKITRYKPMLVGWWLLQQLVTDFDELVAPVVRYDCLPLLIPLSESLR